MHICPAPSIAVLFLCFTGIAGAVSSKPASAQPSEDISVNCGSPGNSMAVNGREWLGEGHPKSSLILEIRGSSTTSTAIHKKLVSDANTTVPYTSARISRYQFSYVFRVNPGQKILRLHFNPVPYKGFKGFNDLFTVEVGHFTLLGNFSASLAAQPLAVNSIVKEFYLYAHDEHMTILFSPANTSPFLHEYAFINGIEIISLPSSLSIFHEEIGVHVVGQNSRVYIGYDTALELLHRRKVTLSQNSDPSDGDAGHMFPVRVMQKKDNHNSTWRIPVHLGFRYLIRLHFSELGLMIMRSNDSIFKVFINEMFAHPNANIWKGRDRIGIPGHIDYMVVVRGHKQQIKRDLVISLHSYDAFVDIEGNGLLAGYEVCKLSNPDHSLAAPNPLPPSQAKPSWTIKTFLAILGCRYAAMNVLIVVLSLVNVIAYKSLEYRNDSTEEEVNKPSDKAQQICRRFSLSDIRLATKDFSNALFVGRGGFGKVYKGTIDGEATVAIKRLKSNSSQGAREFLAEIETLSELRHDNLVSLIGYCNTYGEMILVYDYMVGGTLADHLYKLSLESDYVSSLTWKQRLNICIGAARGLDYLHTGNGIIHRDVKTSNILLDENFTAKVSDFGLVKYEDKGTLKSHVSTRVKGTRGYIDPHYLNTSKLTRKSDTYAFGVVLLEVLCGRPAVDLMLLEEEQILTKWARENINNGTIDRIVSSSIRDEISEDSLKAFVAVAERCLHDQPKERPTMLQVVLQLESALEQQDMKQKQVPGLGKFVNVSDDYRDDLSVNTGQQKTKSIDFQNRKHAFRDQGNVLDINVVHAESSSRREDRWKPTMNKLSCLCKRIKPSKTNALLLSVLGIKKRGRDDSEHSKSEPGNSTNRKLEEQKLREVLEEAAETGSLVKTQDINFKSWNKQDEGSERSWLLNRLVAQKKFLRATALAADRTFESANSIPLLDEAMSKFLIMYPDYHSSERIDQLRLDEYSHLSNNNGSKVCLDYCGFGLFSMLQTVQYRESCSFSLSETTAKLHSHVLYEGAKQGTMEHGLKTQIMDYLSIPKNEYDLVFTVNRGSAFKLLAKSYPFHANKKLLALFDHESQSVNWLAQIAQEKGAKVYSGWFEWPTLKFSPTDLRKQILGKRGRRKSRKDSATATGLFVFPVQSRVTGANYSYQWMVLAQQNKWDVLLDAGALGPKDMDSLGLSLFRPDFIITSFYRVFGYDSTGFGCILIKKSTMQSLENQPGHAGTGIVKITPIRDSTDHSSQIGEASRNDEARSQLPAFSGELTYARVRDVIESEMEHVNTSNKGVASTIVEETENVSVGKVMKSHVLGEQESLDNSLWIDFGSSPLGSNNATSHSSTPRDASPLPPTGPDDQYYIRNDLIICRHLAHIDMLGLKKTSSRLRFLINWLVTSLLQLKLPGSSEDSGPLVNIYGPKIKYERGGAVAFNLRDRNRGLINPEVVVKLAKSHGISLSIGILSHIRILKDSPNQHRGSSSLDDAVICKPMNGKNGFFRVEVVTASLSFLTNFDDVYKLWAFIAKFLDPEFLKEDVGAPNHRAEEVQE